MEAGDVEYACHSRTLLKQTCLSESWKKNKKNFAWFSLASELNVLTITSLLIMGHMHMQMNMLEAVFAWTSSGLETQNFMFEIYSHICSCGAPCGSEYWQMFVNKLECNWKPICWGMKVWSCCFLQALCTPIMLGGIFLSEQINSVTINGQQIIPHLISQLRP